MGKLIKDLNSITSIQQDDKILVERSSKGHSIKLSDVLSTKQDVISDLAAIRSGAALGATALQSVPTGYVTTSDLNSKNFATKSELSNYSPTGHAHSAIDITGGTLNINRIPTGTTGTTVALGNHTHAEYATTTDVQSMIDDAITTVLHTEV